MSIAIKPEEIKPLIKLTAKQLEAQGILTSLSTYLMLFGGSRSGKTFLLVRNVVMRAMKAPGSRHVILRFRFNHVKQSVVLDTFPKVMALCFPGVSYKLDKQDWYATFPNGAEIWFGGLDDKERTEKILGNEYITIYLNECSQISWIAFGLVVTRLAQKVMQVIEGNTVTPLIPRIYFDCNPPRKSHWTYQVFVKKISPDTKEPLLNPDNYACMKLNPADNKDNLPDHYIGTLAELPARLRRRFLDGEFGDDAPGALFLDEWIDKWRVEDGRTPDFVRVVVAVDPSGADDIDNADNDEIGVAVVGLGTDGNAYVMEDLTLKAGPGTWGKVAVEAYMRHKADCVVAETNFGGAMVQQTIRVAAAAAKAIVNFRAVTASRGKVVRAEPFSALYETGKVRHVGRFVKLEEELSGFTTSGFVGAKSPNRADALVWALTALFPMITKPKDKPAEKPIPTINHYNRKSLNHG
jgi:phage terminase large subunit-like protein